MQVSKMELEEYLKKKIEREEAELKTRNKANKKEGIESFTPIQRLKESISDSKRLLKEKC